MVVEMVERKKTMKKEHEGDEVRKDKCWWYISQKVRHGEAWYTLGCVPKLEKLTFPDKNDRSGVLGPFPGVFSLARAFSLSERAFLDRSVVFRPTMVSYSAALRDFLQTAISLSSELRLGRVRYPREGISMMKTIVALDQYLDTVSVGRFTFEQTPSSGLVRSRAEFGCIALETLGSSFWASSSSLKLVMNSPKDSCIFLLIFLVLISCTSLSGSIHDACRLGSHHKHFSNLSQRNSIKGKHLITSPTHKNYPHL